MKKLLLFILVLLISGVTYAQGNRSYDWDTDLDYLLEELPRRHYDFFTVRSRDDLAAGIEKIKREKEGLSNYEIVLKTQQLIASFGDSHTNMDFIGVQDTDMKLPIDAFWFKEGIYVLETNEQNKDILGQKIVSLNGFPMDVVADSLSTIITVDNEAIVRKSIPWFMTMVQNLQALGFAEGKDVALELENTVGKRSTYVVSPGPLTRDKRRYLKVDSVAFNTRNMKKYFEQAYTPEHKTLYLLYNQCWSRELEMKYGNKDKAQELPSFKEFEKQAMETLKSNPVEKIIFDVRYNTGGASIQGTEFVEKISEYLKKNPDTQVYVVLGRNTFSSAILNAMDFKRMTNAIFVGEETAGKPNHFGEVRSFQLPVSGIEVSYSTKYFKNTPENVNTIIPDVKIEVGFPDFVRGVDPIYEWVISQ